MPQLLKQLAVLSASTTLVSSMTAAPGTTIADNERDTYTALAHVTGLEGEYVQAPLSQLASDTPAPYRASSQGQPIVSVPDTPDAPIVIEDEMTGEAISMTLDETVDDAGVEYLPGNLIAYVSPEKYSTVPLAKNDGSVQVATVIQDENAPTEFRYKMDLPAGGRFEKTPPGGYMIVGRNGAYEGGIAPPWAVDANGSEVETSFRIDDGDTLVQTVKHGVGTSYPVVADPMWGKDLISSVKWISRDKVVSMSITPTGWNRFNTGFGTAISAGWEEAKAKTPRSIIAGKTYSKSTANTTQMYWQYQCHQVGAFWKDTWNLEPHRRRGTYQDYVANLCN